MKRRGGRPRGDRWYDRDRELDPTGGPSFAGRGHHAAAMRAVRGASPMGAGGGGADATSFLEALGGVALLGLGGFLLRIGKQQMVGGSRLLLWCIGVALLGMGVLVLADGLRRAWRRRRLARQMREVEEREPDLLDEIAAARAEGVNPVDRLVALGITDMRVRQYLLGRAAGRIDDPIHVYVRRRGRS